LTTATSYHTTAPGDKWHFREGKLAAKISLGHSQETEQAFCPPKNLRHDRKPSTQSVGGAEKVGHSGGPEGATELVTVRKRRDAGYDV